jgi:hypothetical protein
MPGRQLSAMRTFAPEVRGQDTREISLLHPTRKVAEVLVYHLAHLTCGDIIILCETVH